MTPTPAYLDILSEHMMARCELKAFDLWLIGDFTRENMSAISET